MEPYNDIPGKLRLASQQRLDAKTEAISEATLANLGTLNNLAYTYYDGLVVYCKAEKTNWIWKEDPIGLSLVPKLNMPIFTYPAGWLVDDIDYSNKKFSFYKVLEQDNYSKIIYIAHNQLSGSGTIEEQICAYINSINYSKKDTDADVWVEFDTDVIVPVAIDCQMSDWGMWSECSPEGFKSRSRSIIVAPSNGGKSCPVDTETVSCIYIPPVEPIPVVDAVMSEWGEYSACRIDETKVRYRTILTSASGGGITPTLSESQSCTYVPPVGPVDCVMTEWSEWSLCRIDGTQTRTRSVLTPASNGGDVCPVLFENRACTYVPPLNPRTLVFLYEDPCGLPFADLWGDTVTELHYIGETNLVPYTGYGYDFKGTADSGTNDFEWASYEFNNGVKTETGYTFSPCQP